jgi:hypothetical protein
MEFLTEVLLTVPPGTPDDEVARRRGAEAARTLPLFDWMTVPIRSLGLHPSDPG